MRVSANQVIRKCNPATGALLREVPCTPIEALPELLHRARAAQKKWGALSPKERGRKLRDVAAAISNRADELAGLIAAETGKPVVEAVLQEVFSAAHLANYFGKNLARILKPKSLSLSLFVHKRSTIYYVPRGVVGIIAPWNFPLAIPCGDTMMALAAGNAVVLKPSEHTPLCGLILRDIITEAGLDPDLLQVAVGYGDVGAALVRSGVNMIHFTGSVPTGRKIATACGEQLLPCVLELGGKDAAIVLEDADIEHAARTLAFGAFLNAGQACASVERVYAVGNVYQPLVKRLVEITTELRQGDGTRNDVDVGPMIVASQLDIVGRHVEEARQRGATVRTGGHPEGPYYAPTVLTEVTDDMAVCRDETFGPVLPVMPVASIDEAVTRANGTAYGLSAYVFTRNVQRGREVAQRLHAGTVDINDVLYTHAVPETPWGGVKDSGIGHTHGDDGVRHLCEPRHVNHSWLPAFPNIWLYPYKRAMVEPCIDLMRGWFGKSSSFNRLRLVLRGATSMVRVLRGR